MGFIDNLRNLVKGNGDEKEKAEDPYAKSMLITQVVNLVEQINRINSFDSSIRTLTNITSYQLNAKSFSELQQLKSTLSDRLSTLEKSTQRSNAKSTALEEAKLTGVKPTGMTDREFDRFQRDDR